MLRSVEHLLRLQPRHAAAHRRRCVGAQRVVLQRLCIRQRPCAVGTVERARVQRLRVDVRNELGEQHARRRRLEDRRAARCERQRRSEVLVALEAAVEVPDECLLLRLVDGVVHADGGGGVVVQRRKRKPLPRLPSFEHRRPMVREGGQLSAAEAQRELIHSRAARCLLLHGHGRQYSSVEHLLLAAECLVRAEPMRHRAGLESRADGAECRATTLSREHLARDWRVLHATIPRHLQRRATGHHLCRWRATVRCGRTAWGYCGRCGAERHLLHPQCHVGATCYSRRLLLGCRLCRHRGGWRAVRRGRLHAPHDAVLHPRELQTREEALAAFLMLEAGVPGKRRRVCARKGSCALELELRRRRRRRRGTSASTGFVLNTLTWCAACCHLHHLQRLRAPPR